MEDYTNIILILIGVMFILFGYASLKWRRLSRTITILPALFFSIFVGAKMVFDEGGVNELLVSIAITVGYFILVGLISWLVKPFVVKEG